MKMTRTACIEAPRERVWEVLSDVAGIDLWVHLIESASCEGDQTKGVGTKRICNMKGGMTVTEEWTQWEEGNSFTYKASGAPLMKSAKNRWSLQSVNGKTLLTTESEVELKGGIFGKLLLPLIGMITKRVGSDAMAAFKYLVENGRPFEGKHSSLPRVSPIC